MPIQATDIKKALKAVSATMDAHKDELVALDAHSGDGDLGLSMSAGYRAVVTAADSSEERDLGRLMLALSKAFNEAAPSSLGTITSVGMMGMAKALKGTEEATLAQFAAAMDAGLANIMEKAKSKPGERTILDSLHPGIQALRQHAGEDAKAAWRAAADAAAAGCEETRTMMPVHGRAAYYGDKTQGHLDGGAVVGKLLFESLAHFAETA